MVLLDALQEDLNKVQLKPYIELKDADSRTDDDVADEVWTRYKKRNDSVIVDLFYGLLKLTVFCPACKYIFRAFDPFASLSLPLDVVLTNAIIFCSNDKLQRIRCRIYVPPRCSLENLLPYFNLARQPDDGCKYVIANIYGHYLRILEPEDILNFREWSYKLFAFEVPSVEDSTVRTTNCTNESNVNPSETLCDKVLQVLNAHLDKEEVKEQAEKEVYKILVIRVPSRFFELNHTDELHQKLDLDLCLKLFTTKEILSAQSPWYCKKCKEPRQASKKFDFWRLPEVLIIHLKRFRTMFPMEKINEFVDFPVE
ncbi:unnamed protein product [Dibothriocephalus latus]|uniref:ubiquitinyl hydrolase 1 n=1 Tax=Dibothriocephalus latus TaxID=60516 RepID=A0A3P7KY64_DIBLA|nr:unnamed protein product [Dibothriocephalus latus]